ncbi:hypothetical protein DBR41_25625, partial [Pseudomonas sp. HMWF010]
PAGQGTGRSIATFPSSFPFMRIDHVFLTPGLSTLRVWSPRDARARLASDHLPLVVELELTAAGTPVPAAAGPSVAAGPA